MDSKPELQEKDFIQEEYGKNPFPFWFWLAMLALVTLLIWGTGSWFANTLQREVKKGPFLQVTNRDFSLFLWQNPEYMRAHSKNKTGYLPGFQYQNKVSIEPGKAEEYVIAPPETLFLYHTWHRLISNEYTPGPVVVSEFREFLEYAPEWLPENWPDAPRDYAKTVSLLLNNGQQPPEELPQQVIQAFMGWKNYIKQGEQINKVRPTYGEMKTFLERNPHYARHYWQNIVGPKYLKSLTPQSNNNNSIPVEELSPFLRVAFFNFKSLALQPGF